MFEILGAITVICFVMSGIENISGAKHCYANSWLQCLATNNNLYADLQKHHGMHGRKCSKHDLYFAKKLRIFGLDLDLIFKNNGLSTEISIINIYLFILGNSFNIVRTQSILFSETDNMSLKSSHFLWCSNSPKS